ncbi:MAG TPA: DUF167 domain-containing protein [Candidatus Omnitrophota bacterium]|nr:DUF167 domain-containing protein [Candidatus Omnitrophota bacterium]
MKLNIRVIPNARQDRIVPEGDRLKVYLHAPAVEGKANKALIELLSEHYKVKRNKIILLKGEKSRDKIVEIIEGG